MEYDVELDDLLFLSDTISSNPQYQELDESINFVEALDSHKRLATAADTLYFAETLSKNGGSKFNLMLTDNIVFSDLTHWRTWIESWSDFLFMPDYIVHINDNRMTDSLNFSDVMTGNAGAGLRDAITLTDLFSYKAIIHPHVVETLALVDAFCIYFNNDWSRPMVPIVPEAP